MNEDVEIYLEDLTDKLNGAVSHLEKELHKIRAGKATPAMLDGIVVDYYGSMTPLSRIANVNSTDARTLVIQPWEKSMIDPIEKAILKANIGLNPVNNGELIRINVPALTEERRKQLVKQMKTEGENAKISIRNARRETIEEIKKLKKDGLPEDEAKEAEEKIQKIHDDFIKKVDKILEFKESEITTI